MFLSQNNFVILDNEHSSLDPTSICINLNFFLVNVSHDGILLGKSIGPSHFSDVIEEFTGVVMVTNPLSIEEDFVRPRILIVRIFTQFLHSDISKGLQYL